MLTLSFLREDVSTDDFTQSLVRQTGTKSAEEAIWQPRLCDLFTQAVTNAKFAIVRRCLRTIRHTCYCSEPLPASYSLPCRYGL